MKVKQTKIDELIAASSVQKHTFHDKCLVVACKLPNGFVLTGVGACVDPAEYNEEIGYQVAIEQIKNQLWQLEGYLLQEKLSLAPGLVKEVESISSAPIPSHLKPKI